MEWMKGLLGQTPRKANNFKPKTSSALLVETPVKVSSPKRKRQASPERVQPIEEKAVESDPKDLLLEFMALKQNQILTQKDTEMVDQILKGQITRDQITLYCKPVTRMKRVKITKRPIQYRGVGLSSVKQVKKSEIVRPQKKVKVEATTDVAQTILDAIEQKDSMGFGIGLLPNPYTMDMPVVTISPVNSPQKLDVPKISFSFTAAAPLMNPFEKASPKAKDALAPVTENPKSPPKFGGITFTPSKEVAKEALFTPGFKKLQSQEDTIMSHDSPKASLGFVKPVPTPTDSPKASFGFVKPVPTPTESPISEASFVPVTPSAVAKAMPFAKESLSNQDSEKNTPFATMTIPKVFEIKESQALQQTVEKDEFVWSTPDLKDLPTLLLEDDGWKQEIRDIELSETFIWSLDSEESDEVAPAVSLKAQEQSVPIVSLKPQENTAPPASNTGFSFASSGFKPQAVSGWKCDVCLVQNKEEVSKCISCESDKPGAKSSATKPAPVSAPVPPASNTGFSFASSGFKPQAVSGWKCDVCLVQNKEEVSKCISCESDKPGAKATKPAPAPPSTTGFSFNPTPSIGWKCQVCLIQNKEVDIQCVSCESTKPGNGPTVTAPKPQPSGFNFEATPKPNTSTTGFNFGGSGFQMKKASGWKCDVCMVDNQESSSQCVACETPKPGSSKPTTNQAPPSAGGFSIPQGMNVAPTFTFGGFDTSTSNSSGGFSFK